MDTAETILGQLDACAGDFTFPMLDNGYIFPADVRMSIFRDATDWLILIEALGIGNSRTCGLDSFQNCLHLYGSQLHRPPGMSNEDFLHPIDDCPDAKLFDQDGYEWFARRDARCVQIKGRQIALDLSQSSLAKKGIQLLEPPEIDPVAILRSLLPEHRELLLASEEEIAKRNPLNLPLFLRLDEWRHPDLINGEMPSQTECFRLLAEAIATGSPHRYQPTEAPNTHWSNWPAGGTL